MNKYTDMPFKKWDGTFPLYLKDKDVFFWNKEELEEYCFDNDLFPKTLQLIICEPIHGDIIDPNEIWESKIPNEDEFQYFWPELDEKIQEINRLIMARRNLGNPWSWIPGKYRTTVSLKDEEQS